MKPTQSVPQTSNGNTTVRQCRQPTLWCEETNFNIIGIDLTFVSCVETYATYFTRISGALLSWMSAGQRRRCARRQRRAAQQTFENDWETFGKLRKLMRKTWFIPNAAPYAGLSAPDTNVRVTPAPLLVVAVAPCSCTPFNVDLTPGGGAGVTTASGCTPSEPHAATRSARRTTATKGGTGRSSVSGGRVARAARVCTVLSGSSAKSTPPARADTASCS